MITDDLQFKIKTHGLNFKFVFKREIIFKLRFNNIYIYILLNAHGQNIFLLLFL